ncbi:PepSY-associated TM helix domain-containing protein [Erwinia sp. 9145]|uniref:PepSY-associated TM helix domain-containing protein n=1 Tax=Erwinia sp. 9145 TaxID=1500895 RepID=UPI0005505F72|nr:PepSY-associated TM helix domain-containing protein [Erwinia sp. 9145]
MSEKTLAAPAHAEKSRSAMLPLLKRLHFYIGVFIAPFIFIAALTGTLYVLTPQLENLLYADQLYTSSRGAAQPLSAQIQAAQVVAAQQMRGDAPVIAAVRPSPAPGDTTRVMFTTATSGPSESTAVFIDPVTLASHGVEPVYGTSGVLPLRTWLDYLHRNLLLGDIGRNYSELAASWLWIAALGGLLLWATQRTTSRAHGRQRYRYWHGTLGLGLLLGLLFFSATGLTWSRWAGDNIALMRTHFGWTTPAVNTRLLPQADADEMHTDEHAGHTMAEMTESAAVTISPMQFDRVVAAARAAGIDAGKIEVRPTQAANKAWTVSEVDRRWPTQVDSAAVDPQTFAVVDKVEFAQFGLLAKLTRWGVDAHMGVLFGLPNQLMLAVFGLGLCVTIVLGYRLWWQRRPAAGVHPADTLRHCWRRLSFGARLVVMTFTLALALCLPVMGASLVVLLIIDAVRWRRAVSVSR